MAQSDATLNRLDDLLVQEFLDRLIKGEEIVTKDGEVIVVRPKPATLAIITKYLSENGHGSTPDNPNRKKVEELVREFEKTLPDMSNYS
jgi:DNA mismatch repair protein MutH